MHSTFVIVISFVGKNSPLFSLAFISQLVHKFQAVIDVVMSSGC